MSRTTTRADAGGRSAGSAVLIRMSDVQPEKVDWLWRPYIPRKKLTFLEGDPAAGKTWLALAIASAVSCGFGLPDESGEPGVIKQETEHVIYLTAEDGLGDTLRPRLDALGANVSRIHVLTAACDADGERAVTLKDVNVLQDALTRTRAALLVIDPVQGYLGADVDMHRANQVRPVLSALGKLAEEQGCAVLCLRHLAKASAERALYRGLGSIDFTAAARSVLLAGRDPKDPDSRALVQIKNSLTAEGPALAYAIKEDSFLWCGTSDLNVDALLSAGTGSRAPTELERAIEYLIDMLRDGPRLSTDMEQGARRCRIAIRTLERAKSQLGVLSHRPPGEKNWYWALGETAKDAKPQFGGVDDLGIEEGVIQ
jgi:putative DNA primase/helicase